MPILYRPKLNMKYFIHIYLRFLKNVVKHIMNSKSILIKSPQSFKRLISSQALGQKILEPSFKFYFVSVITWVWCWTRPTNVFNK